MLLSSLKAILILTAAEVSSSAVSPEPPPNIILILADDLGVNDVSWNNRGVRTPNLGRLADEGVVLDNVYSQPTCTPSRAALLSATYPFRYGLQRGFGKHVPEGLPLNLTLAPEYLKQAGYSTHGLGKWHLGFCSERYTPTKRGFDSFYGLYVGDDTELMSSSKSQKRAEKKKAREEAKRERQELREIERENRKRLRSRRNRQREARIPRKEDMRKIAVDKFDSALYAQKAVEMIRNKGKNKPLFIYLSLLTKIYPRTLDDNKKKFEQYSESKREKILELDDSIGQIVRELKKRGEYENSIIMFLSDNGAKFTKTSDPKNDNSNYPLRGFKGTIYEGGTKVPGFIHSPLLQKSGYRYSGMFHFVDVLPTLLAAAGQHRELGGIDGLDQWQAVSGHLPSPRTSMVYNLDDNFVPTVLHVDNHTEKFQIGVREGEYKLIWGQPSSLHRSYRHAKEQGGLVLETQGVELYNLKTDPRESENLASSRPDLVLRLQNLIWGLLGEAIPPRFMGLQTTQQVIAPDAKNGALTGWCRGVLYTQCDLEYPANNQFSSRSMLEVFYGTLNPKPLFCTTYFE